jgi:hypothetical protein
MGIRPIEGKKILEHLVDKSRTWITEDQLRISLSPMLVAELKGNGGVSGVAGR